MTYTRRSCESVAAAFLALLLLLTCGCEDDSGNGVSLGSASTGQLGLDGTTAEDPGFPDGLHPDSGATEKIASTFAGQLSPIPGPVPTVVVCLGDSITEGGYPQVLASKTGMQVIDEGKGGERSEGGLGRIAGVLSTHKPDYICILYGANNMIHNSSVSGVVDDLMAMVAVARSSGAIPVVGTLTPMSGRYGPHQADIDALNAMIRSTVGGSGVRIADLASRF